MLLPKVVHHQRCRVGLGVPHHCSPKREHYQQERRGHCSKVELPVAAAALAALVARMVRQRESASGEDSAAVLVRVVHLARRKHPVGSVVDAWG
jgi:hypothetical protein